MESKNYSELAAKLLKMDPELFKLTGEIFVNCEIKFIKGPVVYKPAFFNLNLIEKLNLSQLKFLQGIINKEIKKRR